MQNGTDEYKIEKNIVECHLPRGSKLRWREDMSGGLPNLRGSARWLKLISLLRTIKLSTNNVQYICLVNTDRYKNVNEGGSRKYIPVGIMYYRAFDIQCSRLQLAQKNTSKRKALSHL